MPAGLFIETDQAVLLLLNRVTAERADDRHSVSAWSTKR
jgi:hypothetical protein